MKRRELIKSLSLAAAGSVLTGSWQARAATNQAADQASPEKKRQPARTGCSVSQLSNPAAIAMWDFSWLLRHHPCGEFESWDVVLDALVERGYNAIRIDAFPHLVAADSKGVITEEYHFPKNNWKPTMWGNYYSVTANARNGLREFIPRCIDRGILIGLSTWFMGPRGDSVQGLDEFVRVWDETLVFLKHNDLLHNIYYVDLLNEYPLFHGFSWLHKQMESLKKKPATRNSQSKPAKADKNEGVHEWKQGIDNSNDDPSGQFAIDFANNAIDRLKAKWPDLDFMTCFTLAGSNDWKKMDLSRYAALDIHYWFVQNEKLPQNSLYWEHIHKLSDNDHAFPKIQKALLANWTTHKDELVSWMDARMGEAAALGRKFGKPIGNTEGWGTINWLDHPALTWNIIKDAGEICARLGRKHGYRFNCTSNFTHPQFPRLWADVDWHKRVTNLIRNG